MLLFQEWHHSWLQQKDWLLNIVLCYHHNQLQLPSLTSKLWLLYKPKKTKSGKCKDAWKSSSIRNPTCSNLLKIWSYRNFGELLILDNHKLTQPNNRTWDSSLWRRVCLNLRWKKCEQTCNSTCSLFKRVLLPTSLSRWGKCIKEIKCTEVQTISSKWMEVLQQMEPHKLTYHQ